MMKLLLIALAVAMATASMDAQWAVFKATYSKSYTPEEEFLRRAVWEMNMQKIDDHNQLFAQGQSKFIMGENEYSDMTSEEIHSVMNGVRIDAKQPEIESYTGKYKSFLPATVDWRTKGYVTPIKNQGQCGSCWAFSTVASLEGQHFKKTGKLVSLSESNLVDCVKENNGCGGGWVDVAFKYVISNKGIDTEASYGYTPKQQSCRFDRSNVGATETSFRDITSGSEDDLQQAVATVGPISIAIDATRTSFQYYRRGVYYDPQCSSTKLDHAVTVVGYGTEDNEDYWLVKNSWGTSWGDLGYIKMSRNRNNNCGIATQASYPIV